MRKQRNIVAVMRDKELFGQIFSDNSWDAWEVFLRALYALPLSIEQMSVYRQSTGRTDLPTEPVKEALMLVGRRGGKSRIASFVGTYIACFSGCERYLQMGETGVILLLAQDREAAGVLFGYVRGYFRKIPLLAQMVVRETSNAIELINGCVVQVGTSDYRAIRGKTICACVCDEICFWPTSSDAASSDEEVFTAVRPGMASVPNALLLALSSPYAKRGFAYRTWRESFGVHAASTLTWVAATRSMNSTISRLTVAAAMLKDAAAARTEYYASWRDDIQGFLSLEAVERCVVSDRRELPPLDGVSYFAFADPSGGQVDSMTLAISHAEKDRIVVDLMRERAAPFNPEQVTEEFARELKRYRCYAVVGDHYSAAWVREAFAKYGVEYRASEKSRSELYLEAAPLFGAGRVELLDSRRLVAQFVNLERKAGRGRDVIDHQPGGHDDLCNSVCGALVLAAREGGGYGFIEFLKALASGVIHDSLDAKPKPKPPPAMAAPVASLPPISPTQICSCGRTMALGEGNDATMKIFTCSGCGARVQAGRFVQLGMSRSEYFAREGGGPFRRNHFGRFGRG